MDNNNNRPERRPSSERPRNYVPQNAAKGGRMTETQRRAAQARRSEGSAPRAQQRTISSPQKHQEIKKKKSYQRPAPARRNKEEAPEIKKSAAPEKREKIEYETQELTGNRFKDFIWYDKQQRARNIFAMFAVMCLIIVAAVGFVSAKLDLLSTGDDDSPVAGLQQYAKEDKIYEDGPVTPAPGVTNATSYQNFSYLWATNGATLRSSKNIINVLLIGLDSDDALENGGRSDSMILASLNKKEKKIYLTSFYRDTWTYMNVGGNETYNKMNAAYMYGQDEGIVSTIENNFKIDIDYYVAVDFSSFTDIINILGGITVDVEEYEANYIRRTSVHKEFPSGKGVKLDGWEALVFARIRKSDGDSDVSRTRRQRIVISAFIDSVKDANISQINEILNKLFSYVRTDLTKMEILSYAVQGLTNKWADYEIESVLLNDESIYRTGYVGNSAVVFVEYPAVSELVQKAIYGDSSVDPADSQKVFDFLRRASNGEWVTY